MSAAAVAEPLHPALQARGISKAFGHVQALARVDLDLYPGEVLGSGTAASVGHAMR